MEEFSKNADKKYFRIDEISQFIDHNSFVKIINKLTDYTEILSEGKLIGIINSNFRLNSLETDVLIDLLIGTNAVSKIFSMALKGSRNLEVEFISNIFSISTDLETISSYGSLKTLIENRLAHLAPQYNMSRSKHTTSQTIPVNEIRLHSKIYFDLATNKQPVASKTQYGIIAASLHDAYVTLINRQDWWNDKIYMKFFLNNDELSVKNRLILTHEPPVPLETIKTNLQDVLDAMTESKKNKKQNPAITDNAGTTDTMLNTDDSVTGQDREPKKQIDKMMMSPFGKQYGAIIDTAIHKIFNEHAAGENAGRNTDHIQKSMLLSFQRFCENQDSLDVENNDELIYKVNFLIHSNYTVKSYSEKHLAMGRKNVNNKSSVQMKILVEEFFEKLFTIYLKLSFSHLFRFIHSIDSKKFAYAFIIKRIYIHKGEQLSHFGYFLIKTAAKIGGIRQA